MTVPCLSETHGSEVDHPFCVPVFAGWVYVVHLCGLACVHRVTLLSDPCSCMLLTVSLLVPCACCTDLQ